MKYSNYVGIIAALGLIGCCFLPWVYIPAIKTTVTGFHSPGTSFGHAGTMNVIMSVVSIACFILPLVWAKRLNLFICAFNLAWAIRNFILVSQCELGECPERRWAIYAVVIISLLMMLMSLFPKVEIKSEANS